jgi:hypothetical protein
MFSPWITVSNDRAGGSHRPYRAGSLGRTLTQGFTLGYFRPLPTGGTGKVSPSEGGDPRVDTPPPIIV